MAQVKKGGGHGLFKILIQLTGNEGFSYGQAGSTISSGTLSEALVLENPKSSNLPTPDRTTIDFTGGDTWLTSYQYGITSLGSFDITLQDINADLIAMLTGSSVDQTSNALWTQFTEDYLRDALPSVSAVLIWRLASFEAATYGQPYFINTVFPNLQLAPKGPANAPAFQSPGDYSLQATPMAASRKITGELFDTNLDAANNRLTHYHIITDKPLMAMVHHASAASPTPTVSVSSYKPNLSTVGTANSTNNKLTVFDPAALTAVAGVADTITTATGTFSSGNGGATVAIGDMLSYLFETNYEEV